MATIATLALFGMMVFSFCVSVTVVIERKRNKQVISLICVIYSSSGPYTGARFKRGDNTMAKINYTGYNKKLIDKKLEEFKKEYRNWVDFFNANFEDKMERPCNDTLILIALDSALEKQKQFNKRNLEEDIREVV